MLVLGHDVDVGFGADVVLGEFDDAEGRVGGIGLVGRDFVSDRAHLYAVDLRLERGFC